MIGDRKKLKKCLGCGKKKRIRPDRSYCSVQCANQNHSRSNFSDKILVFGDVHFPHQDPLAWLVTMGIAEDIKPTRVILNGDIMDCNSLSQKFSQPGDGGYTFGQEVDITTRHLQQLRNTIRKSCEITYIEGNHEARFKGLLKTKDLLRLDGVKGLTLPDQLGLKELGIDYVGCTGTKWFTTKVQIAHNWYVGHFDRIAQWPGYAAKNIQDRLSASFIAGHGHSGGWTHRKTANGVLHGIEGGCLSRLDPPYCDPTNWIQLLHVVTIEAGSDPIVERIHINNGRARYGGRLYSA